MITNVILEITRLKLKFLIETSTTDLLDSSINNVEAVRWLVKVYLRFDLIYNSGASCCTHLPCDDESLLSRKN